MTLPRRTDALHLPGSRRAERYGIRADLPLRRAAVDVRIEGRWQRVTVVDVPSENGEDWLLADSGERIPLNAIDAARPHFGGNATAKLERE